MPLLLPNQQCHTNRINNSNNNNHANVYGTIIVTKVVARVHSFCLTERLVAANPQTKPVDSGCESTIYIHHRRCYYYLARKLILILPSNFIPCGVDVDVSAGLELVRRWVL